jgi:hypothetical protein
MSILNSDSFRRQHPSLKFRGDSPALRSGTRLRRPVGVQALRCVSTVLRTTPTEILYCVNTFPTWLTRIYVVHWGSNSSPRPLRISGVFPAFSHTTPISLLSSRQQTGSAPLVSTRQRRDPRTFEHRQNPRSRWIVYQKSFTSGTSGFLPRF